MILYCCFKKSYELLYVFIMINHDQSYYASNVVLYNYLCIKLDYIKYRVTWRESSIRTPRLLIDLRNRKTKMSFHCLYSMLTYMYVHQQNSVCVWGGGGGLWQVWPMLFLDTYQL